MSELPNDIALDYLLRYASVLLMFVDRDGNILRTNRYTANLLAPYSGSSNLCAIASGITPAELVELARNPECTHLLNINTPAGNPQTMVIRAHPVGEDILLLGEPDSSDLEKVNRHLFSLNTEIGNTARELHKKNAELEQLNRLKSQFLGMAAHDLRTPLNSIMLLCDLLSGDSERPLSDAQSRFVHSIGVSAEKMRLMIEDFLNSTVIESGKFALDLQPINIRAVIAHVIEVQRPLAVPRNVALRIDAPPECHIVQADPAKLEQVLNNFISNAIEYSPSDSEVVIRCTFNCDELTVAVKDSGQGIAQANVSKLFRAFSTTGAKKGSGQKSTGLGLFIAHKIVEAHQGRTWVESTPGVGSTFYFTLPLS